MHERKQGLNQKEDIIAFYKSPEHLDYPEMGTALKYPIGVPLRQTSLALSTSFPGHANFIEMGVESAS